MAAAASVVSVGAVAVVSAAGAAGSQAVSLSTVATVAALVALVAVVRTGPQRARRAVGVAVAGGTVALAAYGVMAAVAARSSSDAIEDLERAATAMEAGDTTAARLHLTAAVRHLEVATSTVDNPVARLVEDLPVVGPNATTLHELSGAAAGVAHAAVPLPAMLEDLDRDDDRIDPAVLADVARRLDLLTAALQHALGAVEAARGRPVVPPVAARLDDAAARLRQVGADAALARDAAAVLPDVLGGSGPQRWLVLFVTPVEARGRSGFPGNYAEVVLDGGRLELERFGRVSELEALAAATGAALDPASELATRWGSFRPERIWRNLTMSPDLPTVATGLADLYHDVTSTTVDGIAVLDPTALAALVEVAGPLDAAGLGLPAGTTDLARFLHVDQYVGFPDLAERVDLLEQLARSTLDRLSADLPPARSLLDALGGAVPGGHLQAWSAHPDAQRLLVRVGASGALPPVRGDALAVVANNAGGNKLDLFLHRTVEHRVRWDRQTGALQATVEIRLRNDAPTEGLPDYVIGNLLPPGAVARGTNRTYLSVYTPWDLRSAAVDDQPATVEAHRELGRRSYSVLVDVPAAATVVVRLELTGHLPASEAYRIDVASQPLVRPDVVHVVVEDTAGETLLDRRFVADAVESLGVGDRANG